MNLLNIHKYNNFQTFEINVYHEINVDHLVLLKKVDLEKSRFILVYRIHFLLFSHLKENLKINNLN